ncbi:MAG: hypothetical protein GKS07_08395 [Nitrosopumilus sp.]|nr:MAG: hypothetical protein GKS07_08395 [Nitrosopumilus sp.]
MTKICSSVIVGKGRKIQKFEKPVNSGRSVLVSMDECDLLHYTNILFDPERDRLE